MTQQELIRDILAVPAETQTIEFKRLRGNKIVNNIIETVVAMVNTDGGVIVLGINDPEEITIKSFDRIFGIEENIQNFDALEREIQRIVPPLASIWPAEKIFVKEAKKNIALLFIPKATDNFRSINNHVYVRLEKSNKLLTPQEVIKFSYAKGFEKADRELVEVDFNLLNTNEFKKWKENRKIEDTDIKVILEKTGLARKNDKGILLPTRAAVLLFAEFPNDLMETKSAIRVFQYTGTIETIRETPNLISTPENINGPVVKQIQRAHEYVLTLLRNGIKIPSGFTTQYQIPERAIKEAITNAVIHRDYYIKRDIEIKIFEDRVEIESPGLFPYNITPANIGQVRAEGYRNDLLVKHLREFPSPPNLDQNEGVRAIRAEMKTQNLYPPIFWTYPNLQDAVRVILLNEKIVSEWEKISFYLEENKYITNEEARKITGIVQRDKMAKMLKNWAKRGLLIQIIPPSGYVKGTKYRLPGAEEISKK
ncbi:MAG: Divergent AAA domain protein [Parcubacteria group bacterium ADurb.Bin159]|nr:MAG: Divergent AAA domain protein [Parcubacteria group bacterium ADurb.Bin159]